MLWMNGRKKKGPLRTEAEYITWLDAGVHKSNDLHEAAAFPLPNSVTSYLNLLKNLDQL